MLKITVRPFHWTDLMCFESAEVYIGDARARQLQSAGPAYTVLDGDTDFPLGDNPVSAGGMGQLWRGVGEFWVALSPWAKEHKFFVVRTARKFLKDVFAADKTLYRVQCYVRKEHSHLHLAQAIGLKWEADIKAYFPGRVDASLYSKVI